MTLAVCARTLQGQDGTTLSNAEVTVRVNATGDLADIFEDRGGNTAASNPLTASATGTVEFYVTPGVYRLEATSAAGEETQIVDLGGVPVIPVATIADLQALNTSSLPNGQQVSVAGGDFSAFFVFDAESTATPDNWTILEPNSGSGRYFLRSGVLRDDLTVYIPSDYTDINTAIKKLLPLRPVNGANITLMLQSGYVITNLFGLGAGEHVDHFIIRSEDEIVSAAVEHISGLSSFGTDGCWGYASNARAPRWDILVDCENTGPEDAKGVIVVGPNASIEIMPGKGWMNFGDRDNLAGPQPSQYGFGLLVWNGANARANGAIIRGSAQRNIWVTRNGRLTAANIDIRDAQGRDGGLPQDGNHGAVNVVRGSWANLEGCDVRGGMGNGVRCVRSFANVDGGDFRNLAERPFHIDRGGLLVASLTTKDAGLPVEDFANVTPNHPTGRGIVFDFEEDGSPHSPVGPTSDGTFLQHRDGTIENWLPFNRAITLTYNSSVELRATWTFRRPFADSNYIVDISLAGSPPSGTRGMFDFTTFGRNNDSVILSALAPSGTFSAGDTMEVTARALGVWK